MIRLGILPFCPSLVHLALSQEMGVLRLWFYVYREFAEDGRARVEDRSVREDLLAAGPRDEARVGQSALSQQREQIDRERTRGHAAFSSSHFGTNCVSLLFASTFSLSLALSRSLSLAFSLSLSLFRMCARGKTERGRRSARGAVRTGEHVRSSLATSRRRTCFFFLLNCFCFSE